MSDQNEVWKSLSEAITPELLKSSLDQPSRFQVELAALVDAHCGRFDNPTVAEVGCGAGITLMLTKKAANKIFLDFDPGMIEKLSSFCKKNHLPGTFLCDDMFDMRSVPDETCDIVFNSGVIEHYDYKARRDAIKEYARILKKRGVMIIAYPNHYALTYRFAYSVLRKIKGKKFWPWPAEKGIYRLKPEMEDCRLNYLQTTHVDSITNACFYEFSPFLARCVRYLGKRFPSENYLRVCVAIKS